MEYVTQTQFTDVCSKLFARQDLMEKRMSQHYSQLRSQIDHVGTNVDKLKADIDERFKKVDKKIDTLKTQLNLKFEESDKRFDKIDAKLDLILNKLDSHDSRITKIEDLQPAG